MQITLFRGGRCDCDHPEELARFGQLGFSLVWSARLRVSRHFRSPAVLQMQKPLAVLADQWSRG